MGQPLDQALGKAKILAKDTSSWFAYLESEGNRYLKLDLLNLQHLLPPYATNLFTAGSAWVIQTDKGKCWQANWSFMNSRTWNARIWKVEYYERDNIPMTYRFSQY